MDKQANLPTSTIAEHLLTPLTRWRLRLRLEHEEWEPEFIAAPYLGELDLLAEQGRAQWQSRATPAEMAEIFRRLVAACRGKPGETDDRKMQAALYLRYLADYPAAVLARACDAWIKTQVFLPAIAELRALCETEMVKLERAWRRAQVLAERSRATHDQRNREHDEEERRLADAAQRTPEWWAEMERRKQGMGAANPPNTDPKHEAMKAHLAKRRESMRDQLTDLHIEQQRKADLPAP